jgi:hypothetical protein
MTNETYRGAYDKAANELEELLKQQQRTEERILALRKTMNSLATLISQHEGKDKSFIDYAAAQMREFIDTSLTADIKRIITASNGPMTTSDVRDELNKLGGSLAEHSNPLATINAILNRLHEQGVAFETVKDGRKAWERHPLYRLSRPPHHGRKGQPRRRGNE